jgi:hypothetical protein
VTPTTRPVGIDLGELASLVHEKTIKSIWAVGSTEGRCPLVMRPHRADDCWLLVSHMGSFQRCVVVLSLPHAQYHSPSFAAAPAAPFRAARDGRDQHHESAFLIAPSDYLLQQTLRTQVPHCTPPPSAHQTTSVAYGWQKNRRCLQCAHHWYLFIHTVRHLWLG